MNKLVNQGTFFPSWYAYNSNGKYVGRIERDQYGVWYLQDDRGHRTRMETYHEARIEARDFLKSHD
jgi:hypothetical protein